MKSINQVKKQEKIAIVETIRGLAALSVCLFHFRKGNLNFIGSSILFEKFASNGWLGVEAFFVLSGFIIPYSLIKSGYTIQRFFQFFFKRCARIEPPYLISIVLVIALGYLSTLVPNFKGDSFHFNMLQTLAHIAYVPSYLSFEWLLPVYWTLEIEFHYYILIGLLLPILWQNVYSLFFGLVVLMGSSFFISFTVFNFMPLFVMGIAVAAKRQSKINGITLWIILAMSVAASIIREQPYSLSVVGLITASLICYVEFKTRVTDFLGKISFSLYLLHVPIGGRVINFGGRFADTEWKVWGVLVIALTVTIFGSWIFYKLIEFPSQLLSKKILFK